MDERTYEIADRIMNGEDYVYPGHPLVIGLYIMEAFPDIEDAMSEDGPNAMFKKALQSSTVPGAGGAVSSALNVLQLMKDNILSVEKGIELTRKSWASQSFPANVEDGQLQADRFESIYVEKAKQWLGLNNPAPK